MTEKDIFWCAKMAYPSGIADQHIDVAWLIEIGIWFLQQKWTNSILTCNFDTFNSVYPRVYL